MPFPSARTALVALSLAPFALACSVTVKTQTKFTSSAVTKSSSVNWTGQAITVNNANGTTTVTGDPNAKSVSISAVPFAFADTQADGNAAIADEQNTISLGDSSGFSVACGQASAAHGSAATGTTGCDLTVTIPAGSGTTGVTLTVQSANGPVTVTGVTGAGGQTVSIVTDNGDATGTGITGSVKIHSGNGSATGSVSPPKGATVEVSTVNGDATLDLPADFAADALKLEGSSVTITGFSDVTASSTSRGTAGSGAASVTVSTGNGTATLASQ